MFTSYTNKAHQILTAKLRKALAQLPYVPRTVRLLWHVARPWTIGWIILLVVQGLLPAATVYLTKLVVDGMVKAIRGGGSWQDVRVVLILVALLGGIMLLMEVVRSAIGWIRTVQAEYLQDHINDLIHTKSAAADLAFYEFPDYYDHLHRARGEASYRPVALLENLGSLLQNAITLVAMGAILIPLGPWLSVALLVSTLPAFFVVMRYALVEYQWRLRKTSDERRTRYYDWLLTAAEAAAELRLFGLGGHFQSAYQTLRRRLRNERLQMLKQQSLAELFAGVLALLITGAALTWMVWQAMRGQVTLGDLALIYAAFNQGQRLMRSLLQNVGQLYANSLFLSNLFEFLALESLVMEPSPDKAKTPRGLYEEISFKQISFRYPESQREALDDFSLTVPAGQIVAIVGPNGAGKSTLIKLLCRFYDPASGSIEIDGTDLKQIPTRHLRGLVTVLFQQPVHYNVTVSENIEYGDLEREPEMSEIQAAVEAAGAEEIVSRLPDGYHSLLGRWFAGGTELSVGEWQRIALARAFLRRAPIIILDEPTSALDPWAEADWLERFRRLAAGRTAIVITHRLTTAMHADVIHVMEQGRIVESGNHDELLKRDGRYAESWNRQMNATESVGLYKA
ncbi:MAG: ABC transporter ATP-binding protein/permease [Acidobacteria bacterium]|nr:ABC transporter ATP-binding protein/permease [Acidobacteriota bacterium]